MRRHTCVIVGVLFAGVSLSSGAAYAESSFDVEAGQWRAEPDASRPFGDFVSLLKESPEEHHLKRKHAASWDALWTPEALYIEHDQVERYGMAHPSVQQALEEIFGPGYPLPTTVLKMPLDIDVRARPPVVAFVNFWTGPARSTMGYYLARMGRYEALIRSIFREEGVPEDMIYLCLIESGFSPRAHSIANAGGMWQFIPATAVNYGLRIDGEVDERRDPVKATRAAARLLRNLYEKLGSWPLAMAGYNAGSGHVMQAMRKANSNNYWAIARRGGLCDRTRDYVAKILAAALIGNNRAMFGFEGIVPREPVAFEVIQVPSGTSLSAVADAVGVGVDALRALNPELLAARTPGRGQLYPLNIPRGRTRAFVENFDQVAAQIIT
ncbi:MAG: lytic transglycosylase domain-containing protein [Myxococcota bacterium]